MSGPLISLFPAETKSTGYPGNKYNNGSYKQIINELPPHTNFISAFAGTCAVLKHKLPCTGTTMAFELDPAVISTYYSSGQMENIELLNEDFIKWYKLTAAKLTAATLIYQDPPYLMQSRKSQRQLYEYEMTKQQHVDLLQLNLTTMANVVISAYRNDLYDTMLKGWRIKEWKVSTHSGTAVECIYMNYAKPRELHQYNFLGANRTDRQMIKRKRARWINKLQNMTDQERYGLMEAINIYHSGKRSH